MADLARDIGVSLDTIRRWVGVLDATYAAERRLPYWRNVRTRLVKTPKLFMCDSGLMAAALGVTAWTPHDPPVEAGALLETWVHNELAVHTEVADPPVELHFYRTHSQVEVDFVLARGQRLLPIEVKITKTVRSNDTRSIESFIEQFPRQASYGIVLYAGDRVVPLSGKAIAVPLGRFLAP